MSKKNKPPYPLKRPRQKSCASAETVAAYLARGGRITVLPSQEVLPRRLVSPRKATSAYEDVFEDMIL